MKLLHLLFLSIILIYGCESNTSNLDLGLYAEIKTNKGDLLLKLESKKTPITVANFISLAEGSNTLVSEEFKNKKFYNGSVFHRVIPEFMIQGGDPTKTGSGGPGYRFNDEITDLVHSEPGILSMANSGANTNGSQFFITHKATPWLDGKHTVFGKIINGQNIVDSIEQNDIIQKISILRIGKEAKKFNAPYIISSYFSEKEKLVNESKIKEVLLLKEMTEEMTQTSSGLWYKITKKTTGSRPEKGDIVKVHYTGMLIDGKVFDSSLGRNMPIEFPLGEGRVIKGWDEGISLVPMGGSAKFIIPSNLAYGEQGAGGLIPSNATLIFEVELISFKKTNQ